MIPSTGPKTAQIAVVYEAPGAEDLKTSIPLSGKGGKLLRSLLKENNIEDTSYITNFVKKRILQNDFANLHKTGKDFYEWKSILINELKSLKNLKVIISVGANVTNALLCRTDLMNIRGSIFTTTFNIPIVPIIHPSYVIRQSKSKGYDFLPITSMDIKKAVRVSNHGLSIITKRFFHTITNPHDAIKLLDRFKSGPLSFDIETIPSLNKITVLGFATSHTEAWAINISNFSPSELILIYDALKKITTNPNIELIMHNAQFEMWQLYPYIGKFTCKIFDTMLAFHDLYGHLPKALKFLTSIYTTLPYYKDESSININEYNCKDTTITYEIYSILKKELIEANISNLYYNITLPMIIVAVNARIKGLLVDQAKVSDAIKFTDTLYLTLRHRLNTLAPCYINPNSSQDVQWLLFEHLGLKSYKKTSEAQVIKSLITRTSSPLPQLILDMREHNKLKGFIRKPFWTNSDGRCRCTWKLSGTYTGRFSMTKELEDNND